MTNYWSLLIWLFIGGYFLDSYMPKQQEHVLGKNEERWSVWAAVLMVVPYILWAGLRKNVGDTSLYVKNYNNASGSLLDVLTPFLNDTKDAGYVSLSILFKSLTGADSAWFFTLIAAFQMICLAVTFRKYSKDYWFCIFLFIVSTDYVSWMLNGMRQFIAAAGIFACYGLMLKKKYVPLILAILLLSTIHGSALLMLPIVFIVQGKAWNWKSMVTLMATLVVVLFVDRFLPFLEELLMDTQYDDVMTNEIWTADDGTSWIRVAIYSAPALLSLVGLRYVRAENDPVINMSVNCAIVTMALYAVAAVTSGIYVGRLPIYTTMMGYICVPWLIEHMFEKKSAQLVRYGTMGLFLAFFYVQMHMVWGFI